MVCFKLEEVAAVSICRFYDGLRRGWLRKCAAHVTVEAGGSRAVLSSCNLNDIKDDLSSAVLGGSRSGAPS